MKQPQLIIEINNEEYNYSKEAYNNLLIQVRKEEPLVNQLLISVNSKRVYCYIDNKLNNLIA